MSKAFTVTVKEFPAQTVCGLKTSTTYATAQQDCPKAWEDFCLKHFPCATKKDCKTCDDLATCTFGCESYGVSTMTSPAAFDYWVALPKEHSKIKEAEAIELPGGPYAVCECHGLEDIGAAYQYIYMNQVDWLKADMPYVLNMGNPCFEMYPADFNPVTNKLFYIYAPLQARK